MELSMLTFQSQLFYTYSLIVCTLFPVCLGQAAALSRPDKLLYVCNPLPLQLLKAQENCVTFDRFRELNPVWALVVNKNKDDFDDNNDEEVTKDKRIDSGGMPNNGCIKIFVVTQHQYVIQSSILTVCELFQKSIACA